MTRFNVLTYLKFYDKDSIKKFKSSYKKNFMNLTIYTAFYSNNKDKDLYLLSAFVNAQSIYDIIDWINSFNGYIVNILDINSNKKDKTPNIMVSKSSYNIKASFKELVSVSNIEDVNIIDYIVNKKDIDIAIAGYDIAYCIRMLYNIGTINNNLLIQKVDYF